MREIENFSNFLAALPSQGPFIILKIFFIGLTILFLIAIIYCLKGNDYLHIRIWQDVIEFFTFRPYGVEKLAKKWQKIKSRLDLPSEAEHKLAIVEAEEILDSILKRMGYSGDSLADRLKLLTSAQLSNLDQILQAHQIRNNIIYDPDYRLSLDQAKKILEIYEKALQELQAL